MFPVLRPHHQLSAYAHLIARAIEGAMLAVGVIGYGVSLALSVPGGLFE